MKYIILEPRGGLNDSLGRITEWKKISKNMNRKLIVNFKKNFLLEYFEEFFYFENQDFIYKKDEIDEILNTKPSFFPSFITFENFNNLNFTFKSNNKGNFICNNENVSFDINSKYTEDILVVCQCGGSYKYDLIKDIKFKENIKSYIKEKSKFVPEDYDAIQVRNTDYKCDYKNLINKINVNNIIYLATDSIEVLNFFKEKNYNVHNFTKFSINLNQPLHQKDSKLDNRIVLRDLFTDIFFCTLSNKLISNSKGGFIRLLKFLHKDNETKSYYKSFI